jgi:hypothetical protein
MDTPEEVLDESDAVLPNPKAVIPKALNKVNVLFMGPVENGYFKPVPDKMNTPPRWKAGNYSLAAGKWPSPGSTADLMDLTHYNGYSLMVMASEWNEEVISQARIFGVLNNSARDVINKFTYEHLQKKEDEIASYISGIDN